MQGLKNNWKQFWLLVLINAFVGSMIGLERSIIPGLAGTLNVNSHTALLSFILAFGISKASFNLITGKISKKISRKRILILGWLAAIPVPFMLMYATSWEWVIIANLFLGINQGLAWSATVIMKIDLVGEKDRGLAMGINEFAGYLAVGLAAFLASEIAVARGFAFYPFIPGLFFAFGGLLLTLFFVKDTALHVMHEAKNSTLPLYSKLWNEISYKHHNLGTVTINGFVNNLNDGVIWGLAPILLLEKNYSLSQIGMIAGIYPVVWGISQLFTGKLGDIYCKKQLISGGMILQALGLVILIFGLSFYSSLFAAVILGFGTALVYPNFLSVIAENTHPNQRAQGLSYFRFWRDSGYVAGALIAGLLADYLGISAALLIIAALTAGAGILANVRMCCTYKILWRSKLCTEVY